MFCSFIWACLFFQVINRGLLHWLKLWDHVVFGKENKTRNSILNPKPHKDKIDITNKKSLNPSEAVDELDQLKRPMFKVRLPVLLFALSTGYTIALFSLQCQYSYIFVLLKIFLIKWPKQLTKFDHLFSF